MDLMKTTKMSNSRNALQKSIANHLKYSLDVDLKNISKRALFNALSLTVRDRLLHKMRITENRYQRSKAKHMYYFSLEFLIGRSLGNNLYNLGIFNNFEKAVKEMEIDLDEIRETESDAALGNGGLGRLAACFLDSMATLGMPGYGYGINYDFGLFKQKIRNGFQHELPDNWKEIGVPWSIERPEEACMIPLYGRIEHTIDKQGNYSPMWLDWNLLIGVPHDMPIVGYGGKTVNCLRLYSAKSSNEFDMEIFNEGDYFQAVRQKIASENVSKVLYPSDSFKAGRELRLVQEYFFVACALRDIIKKYESKYRSYDELPSKVAIQLNDTHPALAIAELMRILVDEKCLHWDKAWEITKSTFAYTNHTLMPEALEKWPVPIMEKILPRHIQIIYEINRYFLEKVEQIWPGDYERLRRMSIIEEGEIKQVRMAHLAIIGSHSVNGVAKLHTELLKNSIFTDFHELWPDIINCKTNGVTQRRWLMKANPQLSNLITKNIGKTWITQVEDLKKIEPYAKDKKFQDNFLKIKFANKEKLAKIIKKIVKIDVDPHTLFDVQVKRIHEYKRQLLNILNITHEYLNIIEDNIDPIVPRTFIFAGKAAPGYWIAKQIIKLINNMSNVINKDPKVKDMLKVVFIPDYRVSLAEKIMPAADLSQQISTAGTEASGTGNMKLALNGALTIGTFDGANIEIMEEIGEDNIFIFGLKAQEIQQIRAQGSYNPLDYYNNNSSLKRVIDAIDTGIFSPEKSDFFQWISDRLLYKGDYYFHLADFDSYVETQKKVAQCFLNKELWANKAILNIARMKKFSSDRTVKEYADQIWDIKSYV